MPQRIAIIYSGNSISNGFGGLLASGITGGMNGVGGLRGWEWRASLCFVRRLKPPSTPSNPSR